MGRPAVSRYQEGRGHRIQLAERCLALLERDGTAVTCSSPVQCGGGVLVAKVLGNRQIFLGSWCFSLLLRAVTSVSAALHRNIDLDTNSQALCPPTLDCTPTSRG